MESIKVIHNVEGKNFTGYVSQEKWSDKDKEVLCTVECDIEGKRHKVSFQALDPMTAIMAAQKCFSHMRWEEVIEETNSPNGKRLKP